MLLYLNFPTWLSAEIIPGLPFRWYGLMYLIAFAISYLLFMVQVKQRKLDVDQDTVVNFFFWGIIGLLVGARLFATLLFDPTGEYLRRPWLIFWPFRDGHFVGLQGMNYYGGLLGAVVGFALYARAKKIDLLDWGDMLLSGVPLGYTFGRLGNFINAELYGRLTDAPWGFIFPQARTSVSHAGVKEWANAMGAQITNGYVNLPRHPTQIYEGVTEGIILWLIIWFIVRKHKPFNGFIIGFYVTAYGLIRFIIDYYRMPISAPDFALRLVDTGKSVDFVQSPLNLIPSQFYSFAMVVGGVIFLVAARAWSRRAAAQADDQAAQPQSMRRLRRKIK